MQKYKTVLFHLITQASFVFVNNIDVLDITFSTLMNLLRRSCDRM
jgi:hypothetical protein